MKDLYTREFYIASKGGILEQKENNKNSILKYQNVYLNIEDCIADNLILVSYGIYFYKITVLFSDEFIVSNHEFDYSKLYKNLNLNQELNFEKRNYYKIIMPIKNIMTCERLEPKKLLDRSSYLYFKYKEREIAYNKKF